MLLKILFFTLLPLVCFMEGVMGGYLFNKEQIWLIKSILSHYLNLSRIIGKLVKTNSKKSPVRVWHIFAVFIRDAAKKYLWWLFWTQPRNWLVKRVSPGDPCSTPMTQGKRWSPLFSCTPQKTWNRTGSSRAQMKRVCHSWIERRRPGQLPIPAPLPTGVNTRKRLAPVLICGLKGLSQDPYHHHFIGAAESTTPSDWWGCDGNMVAETINLNSAGAVFLLENQR